MARIVRWNPIREMAAMQSAMDRIFEDTWRSVQPNFNGNFLALDVYDAPEHYTVTTAIAGLNPEDFEITYQDNTLTISVDLHEPQHPDNVKVLMNERVYGKFTRSITLPQTVESDNIVADYQNGVLTLTLPKTPDAQPRQIRVRTNSGLLQSNN